MIILIILLALILTAIISPWLAKFFLTVCGVVVCLGIVVAIVAVM